MILMRLRTGLVRTHKQALHNDNSVTSGSRWLRLDPSLEQPASSDVNVCVSYGSVAYISLLCTYNWLCSRKAYQGPPDETACTGGNRP